MKVQMTIGWKSSLSKAKPNDEIQRHPGPISFGCLSEPRCDVRFWPKADVQMLSARLK